MRKHKSEGKDKKKGSQLVIRVDTAERDAFVTLCEQLDTSAAREIRRFMREFAATHSSKDHVPDDKADSAVIAEAGSDAPENQGATLQAVGAEAKVAAGETEKPKNRPKRVRL